MCDDHLQFGNMNLISLTAASTDVLPWSAFCNSDVPYLALRLGGEKMVEKMWRDFRKPYRDLKIGMFHSVLNLHCKLTAYQSNNKYRGIVFEACKR